MIYLLQYSAFLENSNEFENRSCISACLTDTAMEKELLTIYFKLILQYSSMEDLIVFPDAGVESGNNQKQ